MSRQSVVCWAEALLTPKWPVAAPTIGTANRKDDPRGKVGFPMQHLGSSHFLDDKPSVTSDEQDAVHIMIIIIVYPHMPSMTSTFAGVHQHLTTSK